MASAVVGLILPHLRKLLHREPVVASGPITLSLSEMVTLFLYFNLGRWLLS